MKRLSVAVGLVGALGAVVNCGGSDERPPNIIDGGSRSMAGTPGIGGSKGVKDGEGGEAGDSGSAGSAGGAGEGGSGGNGGMGGGSGGMAGTSPNGNALQLEITQPAAATDPNEDGGLVGDEVTVTCLAKGSLAGDPVDPSSVKLAVTDSQGMVLLGTDDAPLEFPAMPTGMTDEYAAELPLATVPSGSISFRCTASGTTASVTGEATLKTLLDQGPTIVSALPVPNSAHQLDEVLKVQFTVTPTLLGDNDAEADIASVKLLVAGVEITAVTKDPNAMDTYNASVNFKDPVLFDEPPTEHTSVRIEATNKRTSTSAKAIADYPFVVDGTPPVIAIKSPLQNEAVKNEVKVSFTATDSGAGVDQDSIEISLNSKAPIKYDANDPSRWTKIGETYIFRFDTAEVGQASAQITVDISATDNAGNLVNGDSLFLWLDNVPPIVDLDPGNWRILTPGSPSTCSSSFDPLGNALSDGAVFGAFAKIRVMVYDVTKNTGQEIDYPALADQKSAKLYAQVDTTQPFLIDTNEDGVCDALARDDFPFKALAPLTIGGIPLKSNTDAAQEPAVTPDITCKLSAPDAPIPKSLCNGDSDMWAVVQHDVRGVNEPVVYGMGGLMGQECTGSAWNPIAISETVDGWICYAARADDRKANTGFSRPLRVCYDNPNIPGAPACADEDAIPPTCTDGCTAPEMPAHLYRAP